MEPITVIVNIVAEVIMILVLLIVGVSCRLHKNRKKSNVPFRCMVLLTTLMLFFQVIAWFFSYAILCGKDTEWMHIYNKIQLVEDYIVFYSISIFMTKYITSIINLVCPFNEKTEKAINDFIMVTVIAGMGLSCLFISSYWTGYFFIIEKSSEVIYHAPYLGLVVLSLLPALATCVLPLLYRKYLGAMRTVLFMSYGIIPVLLLPIDIRYNLATSYIAMGLIILMMYIGIDLEFDQELLLKEVELAKREKELANMQNDILMSQIQPHFLFNTLASISYLVSANPPEASKALKEFIRYLKGNLKVINAKEPITFAEELDHLDSYLKIQSRRFGERISVVYEIKEEDFLIPALSLHNMVENCIRHSVQVREKTTHIRISSYKKGSFYMIEVEDDGPGFDKNAAPKNDRPHIGVSSTRDRIRDMVHGEFEIDTQIGKGTKVTIKIPDAMTIWSE